MQLILVYQPFLLYFEQNCMKSAEFQMLSAELKDRPQGAGLLP
ncbi:hypothetical protein [Nostoc sp.]